MFALAMTEQINIDYILPKLLQNLFFAFQRRETIISPIQTRATIGFMKA